MKIYLSFLGQGLSIHVVKVKTEYMLNIVIRHSFQLSSPVFTDERTDLYK